MNQVIVIPFVSLKLFFISANQRIKLILLPLLPLSPFQFPVVSFWAGLFEISYKTPKKRYSLNRREDPEDLGSCAWLDLPFGVEAAEDGVIKIFFLNL